MLYLENASELIDQFNSVVYLTLTYILFGFATFYIVYGGFVELLSYISVHKTPSPRFVYYFCLYLCFY